MLTDFQIRIGVPLSLYLLDVLIKYVYKGS